MFSVDFAVIDPTTAGAGGSGAPSRIANTPMTTLLAETRMTDFRNRDSFEYDDLIACGHGALFGEGNARLPLPPMLMFNRIISITRDGGAYDKGAITAEFDIRPDLWFFECHFEGDPVMPGCLGVDALWQLTGFYLGWLGHSGKGRALGVGEVKFSGMVIPTVEKVTYKIDFRRVIARKLILGLADGQVLADGEIIFAAKNLRVGLFTD